MHLFLTSANVEFKAPAHFREHSPGYSRAALVDASSGSVHLGQGIGQLEPGGVIYTHVHAYEVSFFLLAGALILELGGLASQLRAGNYGVIPATQPHAWRNPGREPARWLEIMAPQPKRPPRDTYFLPGRAAPAESAAPFVPSALAGGLGHFDDARVPPLGLLQNGQNPGLSIRHLVDHRLGAIHLALFIPQLEPGGTVEEHDHPFEESYYFVGGEATLTLDGEQFTARPGSFGWAGVGSSHAFATLGDQPARWIEAQAPQPPAQQMAFRASQWRFTS
jgi:quercetin dioxygenase-like cupin family protein